MGRDILKCIWISLELLFILYIDINLAVYVLSHLANRLIRLQSTMVYLYNSYLLVHFLYFTIRKVFLYIVKLVLIIFFWNKIVGASITD